MTFPFRCVSCNIRLNTELIPICWIQFLYKSALFTFISWKKIPVKLFCVYLFPKTKDLIYSVSTPLSRGTLTLGGDEILLLINRIVVMGLLCNFVHTDGSKINVLFGVT